MHSSKCIKLHVNLITLFLTGIVLNCFEQKVKAAESYSLKSSSSILLTFAMAKTNQEIQSTCKETVRTQLQ